MTESHRTCQSCTAFAPGANPTCLNLVSLDGREPTASDWCDNHLDTMETQMLDEVLDGMPFDDCGDNIDSEVADRIQAVTRFNQRLTQARYITKKAVAAAAS